LVGALFSHSRANEAAAEYGYSVCFTGVGKLGYQVTEVGHCTQVAVFIRDEVSLNGSRLSDTGRSYELIETIVYPQAVESLLSIEEKIAEIKFQLSTLYFTARNSMGWDDVVEGEPAKRIHFVCDGEKLWDKLAVQRICIDRKELSRVLLEAGFKRHNGIGRDGLLTLKECREEKEEMPWTRLALSLKIEEGIKPMFWEVDFVEAFYEPSVSEESEVEEEDECGDEYCYFQLARLMWDLISANEHHVMYHVSLTSSIFPHSIPSFFSHFFRASPFLLSSHFFLSFLPLPTSFFSLKIKFTT
jgi:hypothetical protein